MHLEPIDSVWYGIKIPFFQYFTQIGIVKSRDTITGKIKFYIGVSAGVQLEQDIVNILNNGVPFKIPQGFLEETKGDQNNESCS